MDNHPIPQDVTGFQFKLIGNMTVKQFAYLASGIVIAWILLQLPISFLIKLPFCAFFVIFGVGLAYFPVSGRPMDLMIGNYIKALLRPTEFLYEKIGGQIYFPTRTPIASVQSVTQYKNNLSIFPKDKLKTYLQSLDAKPEDKVDEKENNFLMSVSTLATNNILLQASPQLISTTNDNSTPMQAPFPEQKKPDAKTVLLQGNFNKNMGIPNTPEFPNLITGVARDPRGNPLSNILIEVKDKDGHPVRAFKTNELGRFASATPLTNGAYTAELEDPRAQNKFERIVINVAGQIILPIIATSIDTREELRRSLFSPVPRGVKAN